MIRSLNCSLLAGALLVTLAPMARADIHTETVEYRDGPAILEGFLAYDDARQDTRPAVLVVSEWWGLTEYPKHRAIQLAKMGYVAFVADIYGQGKTTNDPQEAGEWAKPFRTDRNAMRSAAKPPSPP